MKPKPEKRGRPKGKKTSKPYNNEAHSTRPTADALFAAIARMEPETVRCILRDLAEQGATSTLQFRALTLRAEELGLSIGEHA